MLKRLRYWFIRKLAGGNLVMLNVVVNLSGFEAVYCDGEQMKTLIDRKPEQDLLIAGCTFNA